MKSLTKSLVFELVVLSAVLAALNYLLFKGMFMWNPSPLWIIVLLVSMRYGSPAGIIGGSVAAALYLWDLTQSGYTFQELMHLNPGKLLMLVLFIGVGMYLGETRERLGKQAEHFRDLVADLNRQLDANEIKRLNLERGRVELEKRIAGQTDTLLAVYENLNRLNNARSEKDLWSILSEIVQGEMRAEACGIWRMSPPELIAVTGALPEVVPPLAALAVRKRGVVSVADWSENRDDSESPGAEMAGLLVDDPESPVVLAVSGMGFGNLNRASVIFFNLIVERAGIVLQELRSLERLRRVTISDPELGLGSESYLRNRIKEHTLLARRHKTNLAILSCAFEAEPPKRLAERLEVILACAIRAAVRASDGIAYFAGHRSFVVLLPQSDLAGAEVVMRKINSNLEMLDIRDSYETPLMRLKWNSEILDGTMGEDDMYNRLFVGMGVKEEVGV